MRGIFILVLMFIFMFIDFSFASFSPFMMFGLEVYIVPRILLMFVLLISIYDSPYIALFIAFIFGVIIDFYIGTIYGLHLFGMIFAVLFMHSAFRVFYKDFVALSFVIVLITFLYDLYIYLIYRILSYVDLPIFDYITLRAMPSILLNILGFIIVFIITLKVSKIKKSILN